MTPKLLLALSDDDRGIRTAAHVEEAWIDAYEIAEHLDRLAIRIRQGSDGKIEADFGKDSLRIEDEMLIDREKLTARVIAWLIESGEFLFEDDTLCGEAEIFAYQPDTAIENQLVVLSPDFEIVDAT